MSFTDDPVMFILGVNVGIVIGVFLSYLIVHQELKLFAGNYYVNVFVPKKVGHAELMMFSSLKEHEIRGKNDKELVQYLIETKPIGTKVVTNKDGRFLKWEISSARPCNTSMLFRSRPSFISLMKFSFLFTESINTKCVCGHIIASGIPGKPAPVPRSATRSSSFKEI